MASSTQKDMLRWLAVTLSFHVRDWRPAHSRTPDQVCFTQLDSSVTWSFTNSAVHRQGAVYENGWSRIMKAMVGTQADQVCLLQWNRKNYCHCLKPTEHLKGTLFPKPAAMLSLLTDLQCAAYICAIYDTISSTQGTVLQSCGCSSVVWCVPGICAVLGWAPTAQTKADDNCSSTLPKRKVRYKDGELLAPSKIKLFVSVCFTPDSGVSIKLAPRC